MSTEIMLPKTSLPEKGRLFYFTGVPRTGVTNALKKYIAAREKWADGRPLPHLIKLEDQMMALAQEPVKVVLKEDVITAIRMLCLPKPILNSLWTRAFLKAIEQSESIRNDGRDVYITFHACWYHLQNREFISSVDFGVIASSSAKAEAVITFTDDIYDVCTRLAKDNGLFSEPIISEDEFADRHLKLSRILGWRNLEMVLSERIAQVSSTGKHFTLAVKHPITTLDKLLNSSKSGLPLVYLSHPIHEVRRGLAVKSKAKEAMAMLDSIQDLARLLRDRVVLLEPTTVDELRFTEIVYQGNKIVFPKLTERWKAAAPDIELLSEPIPSSQRLPEFGQTLTTMTDTLIKKLIRKSSLRVPKDFIRLSRMLENLQDDILQQVNSRDHKLVEQVSYLVVYRPFYKGHKSSGVREELLHHARLKKNDPTRSNAIVLHPPSDENDRLRLAMAGLLQDWKDKKWIIGKDDDFKKYLEKGISQMDIVSLKCQDYLTVGKKITAALDVYKIKVHSSPREGALGKDPYALIEVQQGKMGKSFLADEDIKTCYLEEPDFQGTITLIKDEMSIMDFVQKVFSLVGVSVAHDKGGKK